MYSVGRSGNVHPSVINRSGATLGTSTTNAASPGDIDEAEARSRAREILQEFVKQKSRNAELESHLQKSLLENERVSHLLRERKTESALERERWVRELDQLKAEKNEGELKISAARDEVKKVAHACAQRAADSAAHLRLKEQEVVQLEAELLKARDEIRSLRTEVLRLQNAGANVNDAEQTQRRLVELAKKLLDSEKAKTQLEKSIVEDRKYQQQALRTIESLRKQSAETEQRLRDSERAISVEKEKHEAALSALHREIDNQREMYKTFVERLGHAGSFNSSVDARNTAARDTEVCLLRTQLDGAKEMSMKLAEQLQTSSAECTRVRETLLKERSDNITGTSKLHEKIHSLEAALDQARQVEIDLRQAHSKDKDTLTSLMAVHDNVKRDYDELRKEAADAEAQMRTLVDAHQQIQKQLHQYHDEALAREAAERQLLQVLENRTALEQRLKEQDAEHNHEIQLLRVQLAKGPQQIQYNADGEPININLEALAHLPSRQTREELNQLRDRVAAFDAERDRWNAERHAMIRQHEDDRRGLILDLDRLRKQVEQLNVDNAQLRASTTHAVRDVEEWRSAFFVSERTRTQLAAQIEDMQAAATMQQKDRNALDVRLTMLSAQTQRLESQSDRESQEVSRLRRDLTHAEVELAKRDAEIKRLEIFKLEVLASGQHRPVQGYPRTTGLGTFEQAVSSSPSPPSPSHFLVGSHQRGMTNEQLEQELSAQRQQLHDKELRLAEKQLAAAEATNATSKQESERGHKRVDVSLATGTLEELSEISAKAPNLAPGTPPPPANE